MLRLLNTKLLIAILAALAVLTSAAIYQRRETAKAAGILEQQQRETERRKQEDEAFRKKVEEDLEDLYPLIPRETCHEHRRSRTSFTVRKLGYGLAVPVHQ